MTPYDPAAFPPGGPRPPEAAACPLDLQHDESVAVVDAAIKRVAENLETTTKILDLMEALKRCLRP